MPGASSVYRPCASGFEAPGCASAHPTVEAAKAAVMNLIVEVDRKVKAKTRRLYCYQTSSAPTSLYEFMPRNYPCFVRNIPNFGMHVVSDIAAMDLTPGSARAWPSIVICVRMIPEKLE